MFGALIEESETLQFSELPCANFLCRGSIVYKKVIWEKKKEEKLKISRLFELQFCDLKLSASTVWSSAPKTTHCPSHFHAYFCSRVSVLKWNWSCAEQLCSSRLYFLLFLFFCPGSIPWSDSSRGPTSCWISTTEVGMLQRDGRNEHQEEMGAEGGGQTWAWLLKLVLLLDALHLRSMVLAWVQGLESEHLNYKLPSSLWHP